MRSIIKLCFVLSVFASTQTMAAANPVEFWGCKFNDGMGMEDLMEWTEEWGEVVDDLPDDKWWMTAVIYHVMIPPKQLGQILQGVTPW